MSSTGHLEHTGSLRMQVFELLAHFIDNIKKPTPISVTMNLTGKGKVVRGGQAQGGSYAFSENSNFCWKTQPLSLVISPVHCFS